MLPIRNTVPRETFPITTVAIIILDTFVFFFELTLPRNGQNALIYLFGLVPARYSHPDWARIMGLSLDDYWPFVTNLFLHGGWLHLLGNMWFLYLFGSIVEDMMGHVRFIFFYLLAGIAANFVYFWVSSDSTVPVIGASGAIAGVMAAYLRMFPLAKITTFIPVLFLPFFVDIPAVFFIGFWFFLQVFSGAWALAGSAAGGIAWWAHVGGFAVGFFLIRPACSKSLGGCRREFANWWLNY